MSQEHLTVAAMAAGWALTFVGALVVILGLRERFMWAMAGWRRAVALHAETALQLREARKNDGRDPETGRYASYGVVR
jgi:hypothetical protein